MCSYCGQSVSVVRSSSTISLSIYKVNYDKNWQRCFLHGALPKLFKKLSFMQIQVTIATKRNKKKTTKNYPPNHRPMHTRTHTHTPKSMVQWTFANIFQSMPRRCSAVLQTFFLAVWNSRIDNQIIWLETKNGPAIRINEFLIRII